NDYGELWIWLTSGGSWLGAVCQQRRVWLHSKPDGDDLHLRDQRWWDYFHVRLVFQRDRRPLLVDCSGARLEQQQRTLTPQASRGCYIWRVFPSRMGNSASPRK